MVLHCCENNVQHVPRVAGGGSVLPLQPALSLSNMPMAPPLSKINHD